MAQNKFTKSIAFNRTSPKDMAIIEYTKKKNFSGYVKRLIMADMKQQGIQIPSTRKKPQPQSRLEILKEQLASTKNVRQSSQDNTDSYTNN